MLGLDVFREASMPDLYCFERCELRPAERQLVVDGSAAPIGARAFDLLVALIERRDRVVGKAELFDTVWPGVVVEENNLQVQISSLRKVLGPGSIATVPGRGYQFVVPLRADSVDETSERALPPNNLPAARTRFVGREQALADCAGLLRDNRLLTLSGIGGCGKTRLAQELAHRELRTFPDGVWFVDLGPLQEAQRVPAAVAGTIGVQVGQLADHLQARRSMIVLDNCEHVVGAVASSVESLLDRCGALKILVTSREVLGMAGEQVFAVRSLSLPATSELEEVRGSEAVRLFVDHARLVVPDFDVDERNAASIAEICRRLDGIALAIELAAARVRVLSVEDIRARLDDRFRLLTGGNRALPRHQTLHATMDWSHEHLTGAQQRTLRRLAVFAGGFTLAAAARVAEDEDDDHDALECLTALHDKSLLMVDRDTQAQPRYRMLETVRQYAEERLNAAGEGDEVRNRHLLHYVAFAEEAGAGLTGGDERAWFVRLRNERENLIAAHAWCAHAPDGGALALRMAGASWRYWGLSLQPERGYQLATSALALAGEPTDTVERCALYRGMARHAMAMGRYEDSLAHSRDCLAMARRIGRGDLLIDGLTVMGMALDNTRQYDEALQHLGEACRRARAVGDSRRLSAALISTGEILRILPDLKAAEAIYDQLLKFCTVDDDPRGRAVTLCNLACVLVDTARPRQARVALAESRALVAELKGMVECATDVTAALASSLGDHATAARLHGAMLRQMKEAHIQHSPVDDEFVAPWMARSRAALGAEAFDAAQADGWALSYDAGVAEVDRWLRDDAPGRLNGSPASASAIPPATA
jgi:predicted ATPase/DNA-binding winged helix-turn-helix (wHTH) protein